MQPVVAIVGAGDLGAALARRLAARDRISEIRLIDSARHVAAGKALDLQQSGPIDNFRTRLVATDDVSAAHDADVVVIADESGPPPREWQGETGLALLKRLTETDQPILLCAGASQRQLIERGIYELGIARRRLLGTAPSAWASGVRARVALELDASPSDLHIAAIGRPPTEAVICWSTASLGGVAIEQLITPPQIRRLDQLASRLWPPGPQALASGAAAAVEAIVTGKHPTLCCFVGIQGELGVRRGAVVALPVKLDARGLERVVEPTLSVQERVRLENVLRLRGEA